MKKLNDAQRRAVEYCDGPLLILAGAGSGKTRVLTHKTMYLIRNCGINPGEILAVTFTNKAANEMKERIRKLLGISTWGLWISTFHSACIRILRAHADSIGYSKSFTVYDDSDQKAFVKKCMVDLEINLEQLKPKSVQQMINRGKNNLLSPEAMLERAYTQYDKSAAKVYGYYQSAMVQNNTMDFGDILSNAVALLESNPDILKKYQQMFRYILVDEYQDTNIAQYSLLKMLAKEHKKICVVGDDDQSIYRFRGANILNILNFERDYKNVEVIKLEENYRSTKNILKAAHGVISLNTSRKAKELFTQKEEGDKIKCFNAQSDVHEAKYVIAEILKFCDAGIPFKDIAIFFRTNAQSRVFEEEFFKAGVPYILIGGLKFYARAEIKDIIAYLKIISGVNDIISIKRIINRPRRGIGKMTFEKVEKYMTANGCDFFSAVPDLIDTGAVKKNICRKLADFTALITGLKEYASTNNIGDLIKHLYKETGYQEMLADDPLGENKDRINNVDEFIAGAYQFVEESPETDLSTFLDFISLVSDIDKYDESSDRVTLITLHSAKGLEFPVVFMTGMEEGVFPHIRSFDSKEDIAEERRLCYVGITRAKQHLIITHASSRHTYNMPSLQKPSRFLKDIPSHLLERINGGGLSKRGSFSGDLFPGRRTFHDFHEDPHGEKYQQDIIENHFYDEDSSNEYIIGAKYAHPVFGIGILKSVEGSPGNEKLTIYFPRAGRKKILATFAKLRRC